MSENKLDRTKLKRQAQRVESYSVLLSKRSGVFKNDSMHIVKSRIENRIKRSLKLEHFKIGLKDYQEENRKKYYNEQCSSPVSENPSSSSDSSQEFHQSLYRNWRSVKNNPNQYEEDATPVMTRSATRKYTSVGAIYNKVDFEQELKVKRKWPVSICSLPPNLPVNNLLLKDAISRSLNYVMAFCKYATFLKTKPLKKMFEKNLGLVSNKFANFIDLFPYLSKEPLPENRNNQTQITLHLNESVLSHPFINEISINNEDQRQALIIEEVDELETITLHSGETYIPDNKYTSNSNSVFVNLSETRASKAIQSNPFEDSMMAVYNDHTYAKRYSENICVVESQLNEVHSLLEQENSELALQNALKDLLLNTTILKCLVSGSTPQEMIELLNEAHHEEYF